MLAAFLTLGPQEYEGCSCPVLLGAKCKLLLTVALSFRTYTSLGRIAVYSQTVTQLILDTLVYKKKEITTHVLQQHFKIPT